MNFLYPGFLFALFAAAIPVIIHLFNFRQFKKVKFSNVAFIQEVEERNASRERLKNLLVMAARILAIVFLVLAFAQPYSQTAEHGNPHTETMVSIYLDNSFSMDAVNKDGSLLDEARRRAKEIAAAYAQNDRFQLLTNDFEGQHQRLLSREAFISAVDEVKISPATRRLAAVATRQQAIFSGTGPRHLYVLSDFQRSFAGQEALQIDSGVRVAFVKLQANPQPNVAVDWVWTASPVHRPGGSEKLLVRVHNYGSKAAENIPLRLSINGVQKAVSSLNIAPNKSVTDTLVFSGLRPGWQRAELQIKDFPITFDDRFLFTFQVRDGQSVLHVTGAEAGGQFGALLAAEPFFKTTHIPEGAINVSAFGQHELVVLDGLETPTDGLATALKPFVEQGGSLLILPDLKNSQNYTPFLQALGLPGIGGMDTAVTRISHVDFKHPLYQNVFDALPAKPSLPQVKGFLLLGQSGAGREDIMSLPGNRPAFARFPRGSGSVYLSMVGFTPADGDFARHPLVVPVLLNVAFAAGRQPAMFHVLGRDMLLQAPQANLTERQLPRLQSGTDEILPELRRENGQTLLYIADQARRQDFYTLTSAGAEIAVYAFNTDRSESDLTYAGNSTLRALGGNQKIQVIDMRSDSVAAGVARQNNRTELWKLCLILALAFIAAEIVLIRFLNHSGNKKAS